MATAVPLELRRLVQEASALAGVVRGSLGPQGGQVLLSRPTGEVLLSRDGRQVLEALNVASPTARMMIACISTHCSLTGDGAKTFIILLSTLLQALEKLAKGDSTSFCDNIQGREKYKEKLFKLRQISRVLMMIQTEILDNLMTQKLVQHFLSVFSVSHTEMSSKSMRLVLEAYFCGKVGYNRQKFLSELTSDFYFKVTADKNRRDILCLVDEFFAELHVTVTGLPVSRSQILEGLVLPRDFAIYCPADGEKRVLIITESIHSSFSELGVEVMITTTRQYDASEIWIRKRTEALIKHMQDNNIKVLLSSVKQQETVHYYAKNCGISIVECLSPEVISFICRITNISPFVPSRDNICSQITETVVATFCQPLQLGAKRFTHIHFARTCALQHSLILCGPVHGVAKQHAFACHGAFKMLQQMFTALPLTECYGSKSETENFSKDLDNHQQCPAACQYFVGKCISCSNSQASAMQLKPCGYKMEKLSLASASTADREFACSSVHLQKPLGTAVPYFDLQHDALCSVPHKSEDDVVSLENFSPTYKDLKKVLKGAESELLENNPFVFTTVQQSSHSRNVPEQLYPGKDNYTRPDYIASLTYKENKENGNQRKSRSYIKAGSVVPVGGIFEILLHYYLSDYARQCQSPNVSVLCVLIADVLLTIPKTLCREEKRNAFPQLYLEVTTALRNNQPPRNQKHLESVSCKYQLVVSVLHCASMLLGIDLIIGIKRLPQKAEDDNSDIDL
nr:Bardet-Biedl syndrome 10 protein [Pogona vitticeps]XP_020652177.1 Bardet-Biedl syndrome 10 protein [Pogona vitticeps]